MIPLTNLCTGHCQPNVTATMSDCMLNAPDTFNKQVPVPAIPFKLACRTEPPIYTHTVCHTGVHPEASICAFLTRCFSTPPALKAHWILHFQKVQLYQCLNVYNIGQCYITQSISHESSYRPNNIPPPVT